MVASCNSFGTDYAGPGPYGTWAGSNLHTGGQAGQLTSTRPQRKRPARNINFACGRVHFEKLMKILTSSTSNSDKTDSSHKLPRLAASGFLFFLIQLSAL